MNNKKMNQMRESIKKQNLVYIGIILLSVALLFVSQRPSITAMYSASNYADFMQGFVCGMVIVLLIISVYHLAKYSNALKDEKKLARIYNEMHDERICHIESLSGKFTVKFAAIFLLFAIVVSFFSFEAAIAIMATLFILAIAKILSMVYYTRTYTGEE
jgi:ABC-type multidrug transport system permease subunit